MMNIPADLLEALGIAGKDVVKIDMLGGGISADIWRVELLHQTVVIKRACSALKVEADWQADPCRIQSEIDWHNFVRSFLPESVPEIISVAPEQHAFSMALLDYPLWKAELLKGNVNLKFAEQVARQLVLIHSMSRARSEIRQQFAHDDLFYALRVEPYFLTTAEKNIEIGDVIRELGNSLLVTKLALMQGDISPKNILIGTTGPVFLDAETACYGDPAFDMAFCLTHLMLKVLLQPKQLPNLMTSVRTMFSTYLEGADWEDTGYLGERITRLLQAIMLARVDGKSPVEYLDSKQQALVRHFCVSVIKEDVSDMDRLTQAWSNEVQVY